MLNDHDVDVMVVTEARPARAALKALAALLGYLRIHLTRKRYGHEAPDTAVLIDDERQLRRRGPLMMTELWWWGPSSSELRKRQPRVYPVFEVPAARVVAVHNVPDPDGGAGRTNGRNKAAGDETIDALLADARWWRAAHPDRMWVAVGDFNLSYEQVQRLLGGPLDGKVVRGGQVGHLVVVGGRRVSWTNLPEKRRQHSRFVATVEAFG